MNRISVVTICFNNLPDVIATCKSVEEQLLQPFEHLIIDGSSKPDIKNWLESNAQPAYRRWICERDKGIADAFNKGVNNAKGDIILFMNSADLFFDETALEAVTAAFEAQPSLMWLHGKVTMERAGSVVTLGKPFEKSKLYRGMRRVMHQTMFVRKEVFDRRGLFDTTLRYAMDYDFLCRIADEPFIFMDKTLAVYDAGGISHTGYLASIAEAREVYKRYYKDRAMLKIWGWRQAMLHHLLHSKVGKGLFQIKRKLKLENW